MGVVEVSIVLTPAELIELTGRVRPSAQVRELEALGISYRLRTDGRVIVLRETLSHATSRKKQRSPTLRLS